MIRPATLDDVFLIAGLEILLFPDNCMNEHSIELELEAGKAWVEEEGAGYILTRWGPDFIDILRLGVHPSHQREGHGRRLLQEVLRQADLPLMLTVDRENRGARRLYEREGFEKVASMPQNNALIMIRHVTS